MKTIKITVLRVLMGTVAWALELIGIYFEIKKKQYINNTQ